MSDWYFSYHIIASILILWHVRHDCRVLGENWSKYLILVLLFTWLFYLLWILSWPGSLRLWFQGKRVSDLPQARALRHQQERRVAITGDISIKKTG